MKIIPSLSSLVTVEDKDLADFIRDKSPWLFDDDYDAETMGYTFVLSGHDNILVRELCIVPHIAFDETEYREEMTIDFSTFDQWEYANRDEATGYYQAVLVIGSVYGANIIMSADFVRSITGLQERLNSLLEDNHVE